MYHPKDDYSTFPEVYCPHENLPESYTAANDTKEVVRRSLHKEAARSREDDAPEALSDRPGSHKDHDISRPHGRARRRRWVFAAAGLALLVAIGLGVGLGLGLSSRGPGSATSPSNGQNHGIGNSSRVVGRGALLGSGFATTNQVTLSLDGTLAKEEHDEHNALLFYQHASGDIRWMQHSTPDVWHGGSADEVVATDAKIGTSIDTLVTTPGGLVEIWVFYIGSNNTVKQRYRSQNSPDWQDGPLGDVDYPVSSSARVALRAGFHTGPIAGVNITDSSQGSCMKLFIGTADTTIDELAWCSGIDWQFQQTWRDVNGQATPAFLGWATGATIYIAFIDLENKIKLYWRDTQTGAQNTEAHPLNQWTLAPQVTTSNMDPVAGLSAFSTWGTLLGRAADDGALTNSNVTIAAERSSISPGWTFDPPSILPKSTVRANFNLNLMPYPEFMVIHYQAENGDLMMSTGAITGGSWDTVSWPIPDL